jgi:hypothetical protein
MDLVLYASSMVMWQETALAHSQHNPTTGEEETLEEEEAEGVLEINIRIRKEIDSNNCSSTTA